MYSITDIEDLVDQLNTTIWRLDKDNLVYDGLCCYIAYCIAEQLEEHNISYNVVTYAHPGAKSQDIYQLARNEELAHVSIQIATGNKKFIIGENIVDDSNLIISFHKMRSEELLNLYNDNTWNKGHSDISNEEVKDEIDMTFVMVL